MPAHSSPGCRLRSSEWSEPDKGCSFYYAQKATGSDCTATGALVLRIHALPPKGGRLALDMDEYRLARNALNQLRTRRIAEGGYTDAVDDALCRFL